MGVKNVVIFLLFNGFKGLLERELVYNPQGLVGKKEGLYPTWGKYGIPLMMVKLHIG